jgi:hypothetical protein
MAGPAAPLVVLSLIARAGVRAAIKKYGRKAVDEARKPDNKPFFNKYNKRELKREIKKKEDRIKEIKKAEKAGTLKDFGGTTNTRLLNEFSKQMRDNYKTRFGSIDFRSGGLVKFTSNNLKKK